MVITQTIFSRLNGLRPDNPRAPHWCLTRHTWRTSKAYPQTIFSPPKGAFPDNLLAPEWCSTRQSSRASKVFAHTFSSHIYGSPQKLYRAPQGALTDNHLSHKWCSPNTIFAHRLGDIPGQSSRTGLVLFQTISSHPKGALQDNLLAPQRCCPRQSSRARIVFTLAISTNQA